MATSISSSSMSSVIPQHQQQLEGERQTTQQQPQPQQQQQQHQQKQQKQQQQKQQQQQQDYNNNHPSTYDESRNVKQMNHNNTGNGDPSSSAFAPIISAYEEMNPSKRNTMEDCYVIHNPGTWGCTLDPNLMYLGIYDGHGGRDMVDYLENGLSYHVASEINYNDDQAHMSTKLERAFLLADIHSYQSGVSTSGATVVLCLVKRLQQTNQIQIMCANVGDARAVVGQLQLAQSNSSSSATMNDPTAATTPNNACKSTRLSKDHRADDPDEISRIEKSGGFVFKGRVLGVLAVTRSLGDQCMKEYVIAKPHYNEIVIDLPVNDGTASTTNMNQHNDSTLTQSTTPLPGAILILACDGLWDVMSDQEAIEYAYNFCSYHQGRHDQLQSIAKQLTQEALKRGSTDNITVIVAFL